MRLWFRRGMAGKEGLRHRIGFRRFEIRPDSRAGAKPRKRQQPPDPPRAEGGRDNQRWALLPDGGGGTVVAGGRASTRAGARERPIIAHARYCDAIYQPAPEDGSAPKGGDLIFIRYIAKQYSSCRSTHSRSIAQSFYLRLHTATAVAVPPLQVTVHPLDVG